MLYIITNRLKELIDTKKEEIVEIAIGRVNHFKITPALLTLNQYLMTLVNKDLKTVCKELITTKIRINSDGSENIFLVSFIDKESEDLAKLITFGNGQINGCRILKFAFDQKY